MHRIYLIGSELLRPYFAPHAIFVDEIEDADFVLGMNSTDPQHLHQMQASATSGKPLAWWTIEDPNWFHIFLNQAAIASHVFTTDEACIPRYKQLLHHDRVFWLPLACSPEYHVAYPLSPDSAEFVLSANWYRNVARLWSVKTIVDPLIENGKTLVLYCGNFTWPARYHAFSRTGAGYTTVAEQYRDGRVALGLVNQRTGQDRRGQTYMTSMRTFEALSCRKPFLTASSDAYTRLGFRNWEHMVWVDDSSTTVECGDRLLGGEGAEIAARGQAFVHSNHTYLHRLNRIAQAVM